jgi:leader peptidase (prepilin peptidase)/N-methyltransferase
MMEAILAGAFGLLIGSFLNVCIYRMPRDISVLRPARSFCPECEKQIAWYDNIPVISWIVLGGKCRACGTRIPLRYPLVELITGLVYFFGVWYWGATPAAAKFLLFFTALIALVATDLEDRILPDEFTLGGTVAGIVVAAWVPMPLGFAGLLLPGNTPPWLVSVIEAAVAAGIGAGAIWLVGWLYEKIRHREGLGFGDVKMIAMIGAFLGLQGSLFTLLVGSFAGGVLGMIYIWLAKKDASTYELPFGTFLGIAAAAVAVWGEYLSRQIVAP